jgi:hypothetical protein
MRPIGLVFSSSDLEQMEANETLSRRLSLQRWFEARDVFLGQNCKERNVALGLAMASEVVSQHEEAKWLVEEALANCRLPDDDVRKALLRFPDDARALCFAGILGEDLLLIRRAADMGHPLAAAVVAGITGSARKKFLFASKAAEHLERLGLFHLAYCYEHGTGCEVDREKSLLLLRQR